MAEAKSDLMMAQAVADAVGATKRQIQLWTDAGAIHCLPDTDRQGRGSQRLYTKDELPFIALVAAAAKAKLPIGVLTRFSEWVKDHFKAHPYTGIEDFRYLIFEVPEKNSDPKASWLFLCDDEGTAMEYINELHSAVVINVNKVMADLKT